MQKPDDPAYLNLLAASLGLIGDDARALEIYQRLSAEYPKQPRIWLNYGHALRTVGKSHDAVAAYRRCIALAPGLGDAYWSLANLKVAAFTPDEEATMLAQVARPDLGADDRLHLHYALGKALEDRGDYASSSITISSRADAAGFGSLRRRRDHGFRTTVEDGFLPAFFASAPAPAIRQAHPSSLWDCPVRFDADRADPVQPFPGRRPRELPDIGFMARELGWMTRSGGEYPARAAALDDGRLAALGRLLLDQTRVHRKLDRPFFIDKMPNNFLHIGLIHLILPNAKIIDARRHPLGACFSTFKQHFAQGQPFSYDLGDLGRYYSDYVDLMRHFDTALPGRIHRVVSDERSRRRHRSNRARHARLLRFALRGDVLEVLQERPRRPNRELRAGAPSDFPRWHRSMAALRALADAFKGSARTGAGELADMKSRLHASIVACSFSVRGMFNLCADFVAAHRMRQNAAQSATQLCVRNDNAHFP